MHRSIRLSFLFLLAMLSPGLVSSQQLGSVSDSTPETVVLDVVANAKSGPPASGLRQQDFTVLDHNTAVTLDSFRSFTGNDAAVEVTLVMDLVNTEAHQMAYARSEINKFFRRNGGRLVQPTALAFLGDSGIDIRDEFTTDGSKLSTQLDHYPIGSPSIPRTGGVYSDLDRFKVSTNALFQLAVREASRPGRKFIIWISPGWPLLALPDVQEEPSEKQKQQIFTNVEELSTLLCQSRITLYNVDPRGDADLRARSLKWQGFAKGLSKPSQAQWGHMALQVLALQSGGLVLTAGNDIAAHLERCFADTTAYYELAFSPPAGQKRDTYHPIEVRLGTPKVSARTCQGYYTYAPKSAPVVGGHAQQRYDRSVGSYIDEPLNKLSEQIPELKGIQPATDQQMLPRILTQTAVQVDELFSSSIDLLTQEDVTQARLGTSGSVKSSQHFLYDYLIVHHTDGLARTIEEYRTDSRGNRIEQTGPDQGFSLTSGFALICIHFASGHRTDSRFRYLGQQTVGSQNAYVVGFAELENARTTEKVTGRWGTALLRIQGIAWIDEQSFQILRMRTDLLAPLADVGLEQQTTEVSFDGVRPVDVPSPLWLPSDVTVEAQFQGIRFRNEHRYTNYRRYRVSSKMLAPN
jgi:VWFA-related protein